MKRSTGIAGLAAAAVVGLTLSAAAPASAATDSYGWSGAAACYYYDGNGSYTGTYSLAQVEFGYHYDSTRKDYVYVPYAFKISASPYASYQEWFAGEYIGRVRGGSEATGQAYANPEKANTMVKGATRLSTMSGYDVRASGNYVMVNLYRAAGGMCSVAIAPH